MLLHTTTLVVSGESDHSSAASGGALKQWQGNTVRLNATWGLVVARHVKLWCGSQADLPETTTISQLQELITTD